MSEVPKYYKLRLRNNRAFDEELVALVSFSNLYGPRQYPLFDIEHIEKNSLWLYPENVAVGDSCYSLWIKEPPTEQVRTIIHHWIHGEKERFHGGYNTYDDQGPNAELTPIPIRLALLIKQKLKLEEQLDEIKKGMEDIDVW